MKVRRKTTTHLHDNTILQRDMFVCGKLATQTQDSDSGSDSGGDSYYDQIVPCHSTFFFSGGTICHAEETKEREKGREKERQKEIKERREIKERCH